MAARKLYNLMEIVMIQGPLGKEGVLENTWSLNFEIDSRSGTACNKGCHCLLLFLGISQQQYFSYFIYIDFSVFFGIDDMLITSSQNVFWLS